MKLLQELAIKQGYGARVDVDRLLADVQKQEGCADLKRRALESYLSGGSVARGMVAIGLARVLNADLETVIRGGK